MTRRTTASLFSALALGTALATGTGTPAYAEKPVADCKPEYIESTFNTARGTVAFGRDGCVYNYVMGNPLAVKNYDLSDSREAQRFSTEFQKAQKEGLREDQRQQREQERQMKRCQDATNRAVSRGLQDLIRGRGININGATRAVTDCALPR